MDQFLQRSYRMVNTLSATLAAADPEVAAAIGRELERQQSTLEMIASENFAPQAVMEAQGSVLTNKYAEGYPGRRYYGGCEHVDVIEQLAIDRVKATFRRRGGQRAAALRRPGQRGGDVRVAHARRHHPGAEPGARRPPDPRHEDQLLRQALQRRFLRGVRGRPPDRHGGSGAARRRARTEADRGRLVRLHRGSWISKRSAASRTRSAPT